MEKDPSKYDTSVTLASRAKWKRGREKLMMKQPTFNDCVSETEAENQIRDITGSANQATTKILFWMNEFIGGPRIDRFYKFWAKSYI